MFFCIYRTIVHNFFILLIILIILVRREFFALPSNSRLVLLDFLLNRNPCIDIGRNRRLHYQNRHNLFYHIFYKRNVCLYPCCKFLLRLLLFSRWVLWGFWPVWAFGVFSYLYGSLETSLFLLDTLQEGLWKASIYNSRRNYDCLSRPQ